MGWQDAYARFSERIDRQVEAAPPLSFRQRALLAVLLNSPGQMTAPGVQAEGSSDDPPVQEENDGHDTAA